MLEYKHYLESAEYINKQTGHFAPDILLVLGSGLGYMANEIQDAVAIPYGDIPHFATSTAPGHEGRLMLGTLAGKKVVAMQGRMHLYEGYTPQQITWPVRVARLLGAGTMLVTNASGGINTSYKVGDLMLITDYIKYADPLVLMGPNMPEFGVRFPDMSYTFTPSLQAMAKQVAERQGIGLHEGVYTYFLGPQYETPAEIKAARTMGGDVAGMSTVPECITASHAGMQILGLTLVTNMAAGVLDQPLTEEEVLESAEKAKVYFSAFVKGCLQEL